VIRCILKRSGPGKVIGQPYQIPVPQHLRHHVAHIYVVWIYVDWRHVTASPNAFGAVFDACAKSVYNHAFRLTGDWSAAEEIIAMTFLEAWRGRDRIAADGGSLRPWLLGIATNLARGQHRRRGGTGPRSPGWTSSTSSLTSRTTCRQGDRISDHYPSAV
jgi:hypothetical protein